MKTLTTLIVSALFTAIIVTPVHGQQPGAAQDQHHPEPAAGAAPGTPSAPMKGGGMPMMDMCRQMMGDPMAMPMMGAPAPADPKERVAMLEMHGEMMKAMGDIMMKHARRMHGVTTK
jgi:hypothetical protein